MRKIYSCIDIGSHSTKLVILEKLEDKFVVLSRFIVKSKGIKKGISVNEEEALLSIKNAISSVEKELGIKIREILCLIPPRDVNFSMVHGNVSIHGVIGTEEIHKVLEDATLGNVEEDQAVVSISPIFYQLDEQENLKSVLGLSGSSLSVKAVLTTIPKMYLRSFFNLFKRLQITIIDIGLGLVGDYYSRRDKETEKYASAVINIGYDKTDIGIFHKGILIQAEEIDIGSISIDRDIAYSFQLERKKVRYLKETFAVSNTRYSDVEDVLTISNKNGEEIQINQLKISEIVEASLQEMLKLAKKQISILTNREIHYIIVTGGISELAGFQYVLENVFGRCASVLSMNEMGIRSNSFSSCAGFIEYFEERLKLRGKTYSMISEEELESVVKKGKRTASESSFGSIFSYLTGNKED